MKILAIGANGIIGKAVVNRLSKDHDVISVGHSRGEIIVDTQSKDSIRALFEQVGMVDAVVCMAGNGAMGALTEMPDSGYQIVLDSKVMGQVNLVRIGLEYLNHGGSITLTSGQSSVSPSPGTAAISMATAAVNGFVGAAALELIEGKRLNAVSPSFVKETMEMLGMDSSTGMPADELAAYYVASVTGQKNGAVYQAVGGLEE